MSTFDEDEIGQLNRRLLVVEQLMRVAGADPDGRPFTTADAAEFYLGVAELVAEVRQALPGHAQAAPVRVAKFPAV